jgi:dienelactone hydrolase
MCIFPFLILVEIAQSQIALPGDITIDRNGVLLKGKFFISESPDISSTVILLHGFPGGESDVLGIGKKLAQSGINALTFNYSGIYQSEGKCSWDNMQLDITAAYKFPIGGWDDKQTTMEAFILPLYRALENEDAKSVRLVAFQDDHYFKDSKL